MISNNQILIEIKTDKPLTVGIVGREKFVWDGTVSFRILLETEFRIPSGKCSARPKTDI